jgi:formylglycine-generating enzyme required for sulfatase activity
MASSVSAAEHFQDCRDCARMVVIRGGTFIMGSPETEPERKKSEGPRPNVDVASFAIGETEVTRGQYAVFVKETRRAAHGCFTFGFNHPASLVFSDELTEQQIDRRASWLNPGFKQSDEHPVTCVGWQDAEDYAAWLARRTGRAYRLPSEAEWEYAARAGGTSAYPWGSEENDACRYANAGDPSLLRANAILREQVETALRTGQDNLRFVKCNDGSPYTSAVRRYRPNAFGLYDMIGNVWEYVEDCRQDPLPPSGLAYVAPSCEFRRVRGGSWDDSPPELRSARRGRVKPDIPRNDGGFRLARDLTAAEIANASKSGRE